MTAARTTAAAALTATLGLAAACWVVSVWQMSGMDMGVATRLGSFALEASELALLKLLNEQPAVRENLPRITAQNASSTGTDVDGYFSEGHGVSTFAREGGTVQPTLYKF